MPARQVKLPSETIAWLDTWGGTLRRRVDHAVTAASKASQLTQSSGPRSALRLGTDCSGAEAPVWALRSMGVPHEHCFSSDTAAGPRDFIMANSPPKLELFHDMVNRDASTVPHVDLYVVGFPCKPFSSLHHGTTLLKEEKAKPFFAVLKMLRTKRPAVAVLENVKGINRVNPKVVRAIRACGFCVARLLLNPADIGFPVQRPRFYFLAIRRDVALLSEGNMTDFAENVHKQVIEAYSGQRVPLTISCLPRSHPEVQSTMAARMAKFEAARASGFNVKGMNRSARWKVRHQSFRFQPVLGPRSLAPQSSKMPSANDLLLHLPRERDIWERISGKWHGSLVMDLSQSIGRGGMRSDGTTPTITPGSNIVASDLGRALVPVDKLLLHAFPVHKMIFPESLTNEQVSSLGGNTMHLASVGLAMLLAVAMVDWSAPGSRNQGNLNAHRFPKAKVTKAMKTMKSKKRLPAKKAKVMKSMKVKSVGGTGNGPQRIKAKHQRQSVSQQPQKRLRTT